MLKISVQDEGSGVAEITIENSISDEENSDITKTTVKTFTYGDKQQTIEEELKVVAPYQKYLRGIKITAKDNENNKQKYEIKNLSSYCEEYIITTADELQELAKQVNSGKNCTGLTIELGNDIDLSKIENFTPIGTSGYQFKGSFNGNGYTISSLKIKDRSNEYTGLFGYVGKDGSIKNVKIKDCYITVSGKTVGGLEYL